MCRAVKEHARYAEPRCLHPKPKALTSVLCCVYTKFFLTLFTAHKTNPLQGRAGSDHRRRLPLTPDCSKSSR